MIPHVSLEISGNVGLVRTFGALHIGRFSAVGFFMDVKTLFVGIGFPALVASVSIWKY